MRLSRSTDIGLRILMLGAVSEGLLTVDRLAQSLRVPRHYLAKVVQRLQRIGLIETVRGRGGGVRLTSSAAETSIGVIVRELEGGGEIVVCEVRCPARSAAAAACARRSGTPRKAFYLALDPFTVGDLAAAPTHEALLNLT